MAAESTYGTISAIRPSTGKIVWQRKTAWLWSGSLATAGGLLFVGDNDGWFRAYDARSGKTLWEFFCGAGVNAPPIAFEQDGEQFIAVIAAGSRYSSLHGSALLVFGLGAGRASAPGATPSEAAPSPSASAAPWPPEGATRAGAHLAYAANQRTAWIDLQASAMRFNGTANGAETFVVPLGWTVELRMRNTDALPHSARVVARLDTIPLTLPAATAPGAETANAEAGLPHDAAQTFRWTADRAGDFLIACAVPGHAAAGMYLRLVVQADAALPTSSTARRR